jgi:hypothetical protein
MSVRSRLARWYRVVGTAYHVVCRQTSVNGDSWFSVNYNIKIPTIFNNFNGQNCFLGVLRFVSFIGLLRTTHIMVLMRHIPILSLTS